MKTFKFHIDINSIYDPHSMASVYDSRMTISRRIISKIIKEQNILMNENNGHTFYNLIVGFDILEYLIDIPSYSIMPLPLKHKKQTNGLNDIGTLMGINLYTHNKIKGKELLFFNDKKDIQKLYRDKKLKRILNEI